MSLTDNPCMLSGGKYVKISKFSKNTDAKLQKMQKNSLLT